MPSKANDNLAPSTHGRERDDGARNEQPENMNLGAQLYDPARIHAELPAHIHELLARHPDVLQPPLQADGTPRFTVHPPVPTPAFPGPLHHGPGAPQAQAQRFDQPLPPMRSDRDVGRVLRAPDVRMPEGHGDVGGAGGDGGPGGRGGAGAVGGAGGNGGAGGAGGRGGRGGPGGAGGPGGVGGPGGRGGAGGAGGPGGDGTDGVNGVDGHHGGCFAYGAGSGGYASGFRYDSNDESGY
ncbi:hypothetical protein B0T22DRAFT_523107 [Podospora appendiculata]|uniref:Uncharacterized protein n=1 Tax=Podospora appendiculata TaxID=314037 RepID=A0AAE0X0L7_9PEZI|nr:hypothetical protein B0T22DRAFT_523107 [Podospora appendiculata]